MGIWTVTDRTGTEVAWTISEEIAFFLASAWGGTARRHPAEGQAEQRATITA